MNRTCDVCGGDTFIDLGILGRMRHLRCRTCGAQCCYQLSIEQEEDICYAERMDRLEALDEEAQRQWEVDTNYGAW